MSLKDLQDQANSFTSQFEPQYWKPHEILARLTEEVGELAREINHLFGPKPKKQEEEMKKLGDEISDVVFTCCCLANSQKIDLDESWKEMMDKYQNRDKNRFESSK